MPCLLLGGYRRSLPNLSGRWADLRPGLAFPRSLTRSFSQVCAEARFVCWLRAPFASTRGETTLSPKCWSDKKEREAAGFLEFLRWPLLCCAVPLVGQHIRFEEAHARLSAPSSGNSSRRLRASQKGKKVHCWRFTVERVCVCECVCSHSVGTERRLLGARCIRPVHATSESSPLEAVLSPRSTHSLALSSSIFPTITFVRCNHRDHTHNHKRKHKRKLDHTLSLVQPQRGELLLFPPPPPPSISFASSTGAASPQLPFISVPSATVELSCQPEATPSFLFLAPTPSREREVPTPTSPNPREWRTATASRIRVRASRPSLRPVRSRRCNSPPTRWPTVHSTPPPWATT